MEAPGSAMFTDRKSTRLNSSHVEISYAVFCLKKKKKNNDNIFKKKNKKIKIKKIQKAHIIRLSYFFIYIFDSDYFIPFYCLFFFFNDTATTEIYTLSLHDALPI